VATRDDTRAAPDLRGRLFRKYAVYLTGLLSVALLASGLIGVYFSYHDTRALVDALEREKARAAATHIEQFIRTAESQLRGALPFGRGSDALNDEAQYLELLKLLQLAPAVADAAWINAAGRERVKVSRVSRDVLGSNADRSGEPGFRAASAGKAWYGAAYFRRGSEPYITAAVAGSQADTCPNASRGARLKRVNCNASSPQIASTSGAPAAYALAAMRRTSGAASSETPPWANGPIIRRRCPARRFRPTRTISSA